MLRVLTVKQGSKGVASTAEPSLLSEIVAFIVGWSSHHRQLVSKKLIPTLKQRSLQLKPLLTAISACLHHDDAYAQLLIVLQAAHIDQLLDCVFMEPNTDGPDHTPQNSDYAAHILIYLINHPATSSSSSALLTRLFNRLDQHVTSASLALAYALAINHSEALPDLILRILRALSALHRNESKQVALREQLMETLGMSLCFLSGGSNYLIHSSFRGGAQQSR